jgi:TusA-related sulfurtransferase
MITEIDVRGLPCPRPVVETKRVLEFDKVIGNE